MKLLRTIGALALAFESIKCDTNDAYDYNSNGADWGKHFPDCGNGGY
jgi:hypothetical protein